MSKDWQEGIVFSLFWSSSTVATKFAIHSIDLFLLSTVRFLTVSAILLTWFYVIKGRSTPRPGRADLKKLFVLGVLNVAVYMAGFLIAVENVSAGLISLFTASNPLILICLSSLILKRKLRPEELTGMCFACTGLILATIPGWHNMHATAVGLLALMAGIISLSFGSIYFSRAGLSIPKSTVNAWQITFGGLLFIPMTLLRGRPGVVQYNSTLLFSFLWLVGPVSIISYSLWLKMLHRDPVRAGFWLFVTPALGYGLAVLILDEPLTAYGVVGATLVVGGLLYSRKKATGTD